MESPIPIDQVQAKSDSKWRTISFVISLIMTFMGCLIMANVIPSLEGIIFIPLMYSIFPILLVAGVGFGIAGLIEKNRKRLFSILGLILNSIAFLPVLLFWVLGLMQGLPFSCFQDPSFCFE